MNNDGLMKVYVFFLNYWMIGGELMWVEFFGNNIYCLENVLFFFYLFNFKDEVEVKFDEDGILEIEKVVKRSGNSIFRIIFDKKVIRE